MLRVGSVDAMLAVARDEARRSHEEGGMGGIDWLEDLGVEVAVLADPDCIELMGRWIHANDALWREDIGGSSP